MSELRELACKLLPDSDLSDEDAELLVRMLAHAKAALQAVNPPTWADYFKMDWLEREAVSRARMEHEAAKLQALAQAVRQGVDASLSLIGEGLSDIAAERYVQQQIARAMANMDAEDAPE